MTSTSIRKLLVTACAAVTTASAFQSAFSPSIPLHTSNAQRWRPTINPRTRDLSMSYYPNNYYGSYEYEYEQPPYQTNTRQAQSHPLYSTSPEQAMDQAVDAQVVFDEPEDEDEWIPDRERVKQGEVINFDPEQPKSRPLKNAAASPGDGVNDHHNENHFRKNPSAARDRMPEPPRDRMPEPPRDRIPMNDRMPMDEFEGRDLSQLHSQTRHMNEEYYAQRETVRRPPPVARRQNQSMHPEDEEMMAAMNGRGGRRNTQDFAGTRTPDGREDFINMPDMNDLMHPMHGAFEMGPMGGPFGGEPAYREEGYLGDSTLKEISMDFSVPISYLADVVASWGVPVPIDPLGRLGDMVTGEQAFAMLEAVHTLDVAALHDRYSEDNLMNICDYYDIDLKEAFDFAMKRGWALPFGVRTFLRVEQEDELLEALSRDMY